MKIIIRPITAHTPDEINVPHRAEIAELRWDTVGASAPAVLERAYLAVLAHRGPSSTDPSFEVEWRPALYDVGAEDLVEVRA